MESVHANSAILLFWASVESHGQFCKVPELVEYVGYASFEWRWPESAFEHLGPCMEVQLELVSAVIACFAARYMCSVSRHVQQLCEVMTGICASICNRPATSKQERAQDVK